MHILAIFILNLLTMATEVVAKTEIDYCKLKCADPKKKHAVCANKDKKLIENCPANTRILPLDDLQSIILQLHNERREFIASGKDDILPPAARMGQLFWDTELAQLAEYSVRRCLISDPHCYTTPSLPNPGRSANIYKFKAVESPREDLMKARIIEWLETDIDCTAEIAANFPENPPGHVDFFGRAIMDSNNQVGCAASEWAKKTDKFFLLVCLYTNDVEPGRRLYKFGRPGARCLTGTSDLYHNLCTTKENYQLAVAIQEHRRLLPHIPLHKNVSEFNAPEGSLWQLIM